ncbi:two component, sigma54 specific, transcriptional regulator, Fis family [Desulfuromusa kysingii]|uniref:Two component, sigma54 specific, transcriptional regulator, Fis family n=1 Tax=Desulfuromusa kysingii TaxID=37625 RepID=A0A1H4E9W8_9BACT|nr:sigma-54 dependent transcriptional regulator [Desulfuromusa kysingii]SEA81380.1 two component, sigma54 specific, transcriptional regulator, Fis family [Desulfuromusa kysingii]
MSVKNNKYNILVVDDENSLREMLSILLQRQGYQIDQAADGSTALSMAQENGYDLIISDIQMPKMTGIELLRQLRSQDNHVTMIMMTAFSSTEEAVEAMKLGAYDYITKPFKNDEIRLVIKNALEREQLQQENRQLKQQLGQRFSFQSLIGHSPAMLKLISLLERIAPSQVNVLITGESGTGKELVAKALHLNSGRKGHAFVPINCGAIPENLLESELFGHEKGAFTGADKRKEGLFESADHGTLFLDEIGELPMGMQVKLLRVLQEREFRRVGGTQNIPLNIRLVAATNQDLSAMIKDGEFREDLYYRLNVVSIELPPLRTRSDDIPLLIQSFYARLTGKDGYPIEKRALEYLLNYDWPGNVRELENLVERCVVLGEADKLTIDCLPDQIKNKRHHICEPLGDLPEEGFDLEKWLENMERAILLQALEKAGGVRKRAAELLGINFRSIRYRLSKLGIGDDCEKP